MYLRYLDDEKLSIARGLVRGTSNIHKFGAVPAMSSGTTGTIWDKNDTIYPWSAFNTPGVLTLATTAANGTPSTADDGMTVTIYGLDGDFNEVSETLTVSSGVATGEQVFSRVYRAYSSIQNTTIIKVSRSTTEVLRINIGNAQTLMSIYTVPAGKTAYLYTGTCSIENGGDATGNMFVRYGGEGAFRVGHSFEVTGVGGQYMYNFIVPIALPEKTDLDIRATVRSNNSRVTAAFCLILVDNVTTGLRS